MSQAWVERKRPLRLEKRYEFDSYEILRDFLDRAAELSENQGLYPDMGFGKDYVNMTIHSDDNEVLTDKHHELAEQLEQLHSQFVAELE